MFNYDEYKYLFNNVMDMNYAFQCGILYCPHACSDMSNTNRLSLLNEIAHRLQIEFEKDVVFISNESIETELPVIKTVDEASRLIATYDRNKTVFLCNFILPRIVADDNFEVRAIEQLKYYRQPFYGFTVNQQIMYLYEELLND